MKRKLAILLLGTGAIVLAGCAVHKEMDGIQPATEIPEAFSEAGAVKAPELWWRSFEEAMLDELVEEALSNNLTIRQAWARLDQARAVARLSSSALWPQLDSEAGASRTRSGLESFNITTRQLDKTIDQISLGATVSYQVDLWGKIGAQRQADILGYQASRMDMEATAMTIVSAVADIWFSIAEQEATLRLLRDQVEVSRKLLDVIEVRFSNAAATAVDVFQQRLQLAGTRNQIPQVEATIQVLQHQLAVLLGKSAHADLPNSNGMLPDLPAFPATGIPAELLRKRPDVMAAELRLLASDRRLAVAVADRFPSLRISASAGARSNTISDLFDRWFINLAGNLLGPIFDGGRRAAEVERNEAVVKERFSAWGQTMLNALREVEDAIAQERGLVESLSGLQEQIKLAESAFGAAQNRYLRGVGDYLNMLTSLQSLQTLQRREIQTRRQLLSNRIKLYLALGGYWSQELKHPGFAAVITANGDVQ